MTNNITLDFLVKYFSQDYKGEVIKSKLSDKFNLDILEVYNSKIFMLF